MSQAIRLRTLADDDAAPIQKWLADWLAQHVAGWTEAYGLNWTQREIVTHIAALEMVQREWAEIRSAASDHERFVRVAEAGGAPLGIVYAERRTDRYLAVPVGVLSWVYVVPDQRLNGIARQLLAAAHGWLADHGVAVSEVFASQGNQPALSIYRRAGYRPLDSRMIAMLGAESKCTS